MKGSPVSQTRHFRLVALAFISVALCYADRVIMSIAIIPLSAEMALDKSTQGAILSSFFIGYMFTQIIGGRAADRFGGFLILGLCVGLWSLFTALTPIAVLGGVSALVAMRILMGAGEGGAFPSIWSLYATHVPLTKRTRATTLTVSGVPVGTLLALLCAPVLISHYGWEAPFYVFGALGILWCVLWVSIFGRQSNRDHHLKNAGCASPISETSRPSLGELVKNRAVLAIIVAHFSANWTSYVLMTWLPTFVAESFDIELMDVGLWASLPILSSIVFLNLSGVIADRLLERGVDTTRVRKLLTTAGFLGSAVALTCVGFVETAHGAIGVMCVGTALGSLSTGGFVVNHTDIAPNDAGTVMGITNTAGTLPGILGVFVTGMILDATNSWFLVFGLPSRPYLFCLA